MGEMTTDTVCKLREMVERLHGVTRERSLILPDRNCEKLKVSPQVFLEFVEYFPEYTKKSWGFLYAVDTVELRKKAGLRFAVRLEFNFS